MIYKTALVALCTAENGGEGVDMCCSGMRNFQLFHGQNMSIVLSSTSEQTITFLKSLSLVREILYNKAL